MRKVLGLVLLIAFTGYAQVSITRAFPEEDEEEHFKKLSMEAGVSEIDHARALEEHLNKFPETSRRDAIERYIMDAAIKTGDNRRIIEFGERILAREPDDLRILERLTRTLLAGDDKLNSEKALNYSRQYLSGLVKLEERQPPSGPVRARMREQLDISMGKALVYQARASGNLGRMEQAVELAKSSYQTNPSGEAAREIARWLSRLGRDKESISYYAEAFTFNGPGNTDDLRAKDRAYLNELYLKNHDSEAGLGDLILEAYDRTTALIEEKYLKLKALDPNFDVTDPMEFTITGTDGDKLELTSLLGKVVVLDFWATWCKPCRAQQPLYEEVKNGFEDRDDIVFLNISTDEKRDIVKPFLQENQWNKTVYFDDGLQRLLTITSIPTTVIFNKRGEVSTRMNGFIPHLFVDMLRERIDRALAEE